MKLITACLLASCLAGCGLSDPFATQQQIDRAKLTEDALAAKVPPSANPGNPPLNTQGIVSPLEPVITGTYTFVVPATVSQMRRTTDRFDQYAMYIGRPGPTDTPFMVITVSRDVATFANQPDSNYDVQNTRSYPLNGLIVAESTGFTKDKHLPFSEIIAKRPGGGDQLLAVTIVPDNATRDVALEILSSLKWEATK